MKKRGWLSLVFGLAVMGPTGAAGAEAERDPSLAIDAFPLFGSAGIEPGGDEIVVRIDNGSDAPRKGSIEIDKEGWGKPIPLDVAPFAVPANASITVHFPVQSEQPIHVDVTESDGKLRFTNTISSLASNAISIVDAQEPSRLRSVLGGLQVDPDYHLPDVGSALAPVDFPMLHVDATSGDPIYPEYVSGWRGIDLAFIDSGVLSRMQGAELEALVAYVLAGGELAVVVSHAEDLRKPALEAFVGGTVSVGRAAVVTTSRLELTSPPPPGHPRWPSGLSPADETILTGYAGGNLAPTPAGASATYGLGEVTLLAFDPSTPAVASDPWVQMRVADLARRAYERQSVSAFGVSTSNRGRMYLYGDYYQEVRRQLDPNQNARWAIGVATGILCLYAVVAGPLAFWFFKRKKKPLRALVALPLLSLAVFFLIVGIGFFSKGGNQRARRLTFVDAGGGTSFGVALRYRSYFSPSSRQLTITSSHRSSVVRSEVADVSNDPDTGEITSVNRDGARLEGVAAVPWQAVLVREQGLASLGDGIAIWRSSGENVTVKNRSGRALHAVLIKLSNEQFRFVPRIDDGESIDTADFGAGIVSSWKSPLAGPMRVGRAEVHSLDARALGGKIEGFPEVFDAWFAAESTTPNTIDWLPVGVPVVLAEMEGGERTKKDSGMDVESDRMLVRVVGWGGDP